MLGGFFALMAAATFAWTNAVVRRGVVSGSVTQATTLSIPMGVPIFLAALLVSGNAGIIGELSQQSLWVFAGVGVSHFCIGRYCNYRALNAIGNNLAGPVMQFNLVVSLALAIFFLGERLTPLRILGILLIVAGPAMVRRGKAAGAAAVRPVSSELFTPRFAEGYAFAFLASLCYGASPALIRFAADGKGLGAGLAGGVIASAAATIVTLVLLLVPGHWREVRGVTRENAKWFFVSGLLVYVSQIFAYMAVAIAPVTIVAPIIGVGNIFRLYFSKLLTPDHEVFGRDVMIATALSFIGVIVLTTDVEILPLPAAWMAFFGWRWP